MLSPERARQLLLKAGHCQPDSGPIIDPTVTSYPERWGWDSDGFLWKATWNGANYVRFPGVQPWSQNEDGSTSGAPIVTAG